MTTLSSHDFDFLHGTWRVTHRRLRERLCGSDDWQSFDGSCSAHPVLGGQGIVDDNLLNLPDGSYHAVTLRAHDPQTGRWSIWWLDDRHPHRLDVPVVGSFDQGVGTFFADDELDGRAIRVRFRWTDTHTASPLWEQAFSIDAGATWEVNWTMCFHRQHTA
ncbi:DUF1579 domain-containing protein [Hydrogenophaga sp.]|uniref:DUF1579 domain-containing protein n=1 Tax=Hydrogenophaga sp. TaxID=1904254 RepID=UPI002FC7D869